MGGGMTASLAGSRWRCARTYRAPRNDPHENMLKPVGGQKWLLDTDSTWYGTVELTRATAGRRPRNYRHGGRPFPRGSRLPGFGDPERRP
jgi:hypothetical protein